MQRQNITTRFLYIFIASIAQRIYVKEQNHLNKNTGFISPIKIIRNQENNLFVFAQMNAVTALVSKIKRNKG